MTRFARFLTDHLPDALRLRVWAHTSGHTTGLEYWERRARLFGRRAVLNLSHSAADADEVTRTQIREIFPHLRAALRGNERLALDFGCGPGRFTTELASAMTATVIGADPVHGLLTLAPRRPSVSYAQIGNGTLPFATDSFDVIWICLTLGAIADERIGETARELLRILTPGGLLVVIENTEDRPSPPHWRFRGVAEYQRLLSPVPLDAVHEYFDRGERISVLVGRK